MSLGHSDSRMMGEKTARGSLDILAEHSYSCSDAAGDSGAAENAMHVLWRFSHDRALPAHISAH
jgi:hypothetical protein